MQVHLCPYFNACSFSARKDLLQAQQLRLANSTDVLRELANSTMVELYQHSQCAEGYTGARGQGSLTCLHRVMRGA